MKTREQITVGDAVEIRVMVKTPGQEAHYGWLPATVSARDSLQLGVTFSDGERLAIPIFKTDEWRVPVLTRLETKWGTYTLDQMKDIKKQYDKAVAAGEDTFDACGTGPWLVGFVKYMLQYADSQGMEL